MKKHEVKPFKHRMPQKMREKLGKGSAHKSAKDYRRVGKHQIFRAIDS